MEGLFKGNLMENVKSFPQCRKCSPQFEKGNSLSIVDRGLFGEKFWGEEGGTRAAHGLRVLKGNATRGSLGH